MALALRARAILLAFEKFTRAYLFQIALELVITSTIQFHVDILFQQQTWLLASAIISSIYSIYL